MADNSAIEWTDATWNPIRARNIKTGKVGWHCEHATTGCEFCYAEGFNKRLGTGLAFKPGHRADIEIFLDEDMLKLPLRWKRPRKIFVGSMTDLFADFVTDEMLDRVFAVMGMCWDLADFSEDRPKGQLLGHQFQLLTKRAERMRDYVSTRGHKAWNSHRLGTEVWPARNVWLGVSAERQQEADERVRALLDTPAVVRFVSAEPLLGPIDMTKLCVLPQKPGSIRAGIHLNALKGRYCESGVPYTGDWDVNGPAPPVSEQRKLDWVIVGGESGPKARPIHPAWARSLRDQCAAAGVAFFFKQWGEFRLRPAANGDETCPAPWSDSSRNPKPGVDIATMERVGKKAAGRLLDGVEHNGFPKVPA